MKAAVCQFTASIDPIANLHKCTALVAEAAAAGADLAILPEESMYSDPRGERTTEGNGQALDGPFATALAKAARDAEIAVIAGMTETLDGEPRDSNTLVALSPTGQLQGVYRKLHLYDAFGYRESARIRPGDIREPLVFDVGGVRVGSLTCYDLRFPEVFRWVVDAGVEAIALPAAWAVGPLKEDHWTTLLRARAIENTVYIAAAGQTGPACCGASMIIDPMGVIVCSAGEAPGMAVAEITPQRVQAVRTVNPSLGNRRFTTVPR